MALTNLVDLDLSRNDNVDLGALSQWLNQSSVISLDIFNRIFWDDPSKLMPVMKSAKTLRHLRFPHFLAFCFLLSFVFVADCSNGRLFGCPYAEDESWHSDETKAEKAALRANNSKFALAVIQTLLDTSVNNYQSVL